MKLAIELLLLWLSYTVQGKIYREVTVSGDAPILGNKIFVRNDTTVNSQQTLAVMSSDLNNSYGLSNSEQKVVTISDDGHSQGGSYRKSVVHGDERLPLAPVSKTSLLQRLRRTDVNKQETYGNDLAVYSSFVASSKIIDSTVYRLSIEEATTSYDRQVVPDVERLDFFTRSSKLQSISVSSPQLLLPAPIPAPVFDVLPPSVDRMYGTKLPIDRDDDPPTGENDGGGDLTQLVAPFMPDVTVYCSQCVRPSNNVDWSVRHAGDLLNSSAEVDSDDVDDLCISLTVASACFVVGLVVPILTVVCCLRARRRQQQIPIREEVSTTAALSSGYEGDVEKSAFFDENLVSVVIAN